MDELSEHDLFSKDNLATSRRAKKSWESILNGAIEKIIDGCIKQDRNNWFRYAVQKKDAPNYYNIIRKPIHLEEMRSRAKRQDYKEIKMFLDDMQLMRDNCSLYNDFNGNKSLLTQ